MGVVPITQNSIDRSEVSGLREIKKVPNVDVFRGKKSVGGGIKYDVGELSLTNS